jgi:hypothetical protein
VSRLLLPALALVAATLFVPATMAAPKLKGRPVYYYPTEVGTKWVYSIRGGGGGEPAYEHVLVLTKAERDGDGMVLTVEQASGRDPDGPTTPFYRLRLSAAGVEEVGKYGKDLSPTTWAIRGPVRIGANWENPDTDGSPGDTYTIGGEEEVAVPAGKFRAVRLDRGSGVRVWMAPDVGVLKWGQGTTASAELTTFRRGGRAEGRVEGVRGSILTVGSRRFGEAPAEVVAALSSVTDFDKLHSFLERIFTAASRQELFGHG